MYEICLEVPFIRRDCVLNIKLTENYISIISYIAAMVFILSTNRHLYHLETQLILELNLTCHHEWSALQDMKKYMKK